MRRKFLATVVAALAVAGATMFSLAGPASAQTGSGIGTCTTTSSSQIVGTVTVGQTFVVQVQATCVFNVGAAVTVTVNGVNIPGKVAGVNGTLITITVISSTQLSIDDPIITPAVCGVNTVTVTGPSAASVSGFATQTAVFTVACPGTPIILTPATPIQSRLSLTGANSLRYGAVALALIATGSIAVVATRRRRANSI